MVLIKQKIIFYVHPNSIVDIMNIVRYEPSVYYKRVDSASGFNSCFTVASLCKIFRKSKITSTETPVGLIILENVETLSGRVSGINLKIIAM